MKQKIESVKSSIGTTISVSPAGVRGFEGGGEALTTTQFAKLEELSIVNNVTSTLSDRLTINDPTNLKSGIELGSLGQRRANESNIYSGSSSNQTPPAGGDGRPDPSTSVTIAGLDSTETTSAFGGSSLAWKTGTVFDAPKNNTHAVIGTQLAEKIASIVDCQSNQREAIYAPHDEKRPSRWRDTYLTYKKEVTENGHLKMIIAKLLGNQFFVYAVMLDTYSILA